MKYEKGSALAAVSVMAVVVVIAALCFVFWRNYILNNVVDLSGTKQVVSDPGYEILIGDGELNTYRNDELGFSFDFPKITSNTIGCQERMTLASGNYLMTTYTATSGAAEMTVLSSENRFTITQKQAPVFTRTKWGDTSYITGCEVVNITQELLDRSNDDASVSAEHYSWQVYKLDNESEIATVALELDGVLSNDYVKSATYQLGEIDNERQRVTYNIELKEDDGRLVWGVGAELTWYYPKQKLLVHVDMGQSSQFLKVDGEEYESYGMLTDSFTVF